MSSMTLSDPAPNPDDMWESLLWDETEPSGGPNGAGASRRSRAKAPRVAQTRGPAMSHRPGDQVHGTPYIVLRCVGQGGMGEVYEVEHLEAGFRGALKLLHPRHAGRADVIDRMWREARALAAVDHPAVVRLLDLGETGDGRPYLVMEFLDGHDLREVLTQAGPMFVDDALTIIAEALDGLDAVHAAGIVHRDVKLENIFRCRGGRIKVIDFGVAKARWAEASDTAPGFSPGTPRTMAPEQCAQRSVDPRADLYSAGISLYELCVGRGPFDDIRDRPQALRFAHCVRTPPSPSAVAPQSIPLDVEAAILRALSKSPEDRFQSAREMATALRRLVRRKPLRTEPLPVETMPDAPRPPVKPPASRIRAPRALATRCGVPLLPHLFCALLLVFFALGLLLGHALADAGARRAPAFHALY